MAFHSADLRCANSLLLALTLGCVSTDAALFREGPGDEGTAALPAAPVELSPPPTPSASPSPADAVSPSAPEQLLGGIRDDASIAPAQGGEAGQERDAAVDPAPPPPPEAVATDPCAFADAILCDSFEDMPANVFPTGAGWLPELSGCGSHIVDGAGPSFSGKKALRGDSGAYPECMLHAELVGVDDVYVRTHVFIDGAGDLLSQYTSLLEFGSRAGQDEPELRIGVRPALDSLCPSVPGVDVSGSGLAGGPATECTGFELVPDRWYCVEAHFMRADANLTLVVSIDGAELTHRNFASTPEWSGDLYVKLGRASYGASSGGSVWHDDVAVGRQPIPCVP
jgi:hypothetical protein